MEDPEDEYYYTKIQSNFSWFLSGVVISWAPLFLPSLVVVSALGFAVSVPAGVVLASYTCTEKLMSILLPIPGFSYTIFEEELCDDDFKQFYVAQTDQEDSFSIEIDDTYEQMNAGEVRVLDINKVVDNDVSRDKSKGMKRNMKKCKYSCLKISHRVGERDSKKEIILKKQNLAPILEMKSSSDKTVGVFKDSEVAVYNVPKEERYSYKVNAKLPGNEVLVPGEKILWDKVDALRMIVGYNAARKPSLSEELRALYVFTGVEPTTSSIKNSNSGADVVRRNEEEKLRFLMSIIGVK